MTIAKQVSMDGVEKGVRNSQITLQSWLTMAPGAADG
jgi:hypothetical protein